jgi:hypothetical protein
MLSISDEEHEHLPATLDWECDVLNPPHLLQLQLQLQRQPSSRT